MAAAADVVAVAPPDDLDRRERPPGAVRQRHLHPAGSQMRRRRAEARVEVRARLDGADDGVERDDLEADDAPAARRGDAERRRMARPPASDEPAGGTRRELGAAGAGE